MRAGVGGRIMAKTVSLDVGSPFQHNGEVAIPLNWEATGPTGLFPTMEAELLLASLGPRMTQISFRGSYRPPLGGFGEALDKAILHRVAEATIKRFVDRIGAAVVGWPRDVGGLFVVGPAWSSRPSLVRPALSDFGNRLYTKGKMQALGSDVRVLVRASG